MKKLVSILYVFSVLLFTLTATIDAFASNFSSRYISAKKDLDYVEKSKNVTRKSYDIVAKKFYSIYLEAPNTSLADDALYYCATTYYKSYIKFKNKDDLRKALKYYRLVAVNYNSNVAAKSYIISSDIYVLLNDYASAKFMLERLINKFPRSSNANTAKKKLAEINRKFNKKSIAYSKPTQNKKPQKASITSSSDNYDNSYYSSDEVIIKNIRYWSSPTYTRIVIDLNKRAQYNKQWLKENPAYNKPPRLFLDIFNAKVAKNVSKNIPIKDGLVSAIRWGYFNNKTTRIVLDSENIKNFTVFYLENPDRIVIDVTGDKKTLMANQEGEVRTNIDTLAGVFGLKIKRVVIDPGHGGKDPGASYYGLYEKDIVLDIALELRKLLTQKTDLEVFMTRDRDIFIPLEERTAIANKKRADIFVSIHINASRNRSTSGIETYVLNITNDKAALEVAAKENQATEKSISDLQSILKDIMLNSKLEESKMLAKFVQDNLSLYTNKNNLGVKQAPFYVLVGATMPSILVEADFISNKRIADAYKSLEYRKKVARGIFEGLIKYINKYNGNKS